MCVYIFHAVSKPDVIKWESLKLQIFKQIWNIKLLSKYERVNTKLKIWNKSDRNKCSKKNRYKNHNLERWIVSRLTAPNCVEKETFLIIGIRVYKKKIYKKYGEKNICREFFIVFLVQLGVGTAILSLYTTCCMYPLWELCAL